LKGNEVLGVAGHSSLVTRHWSLVKRVASQRTCDPPSRLRRYEGASLRLGNVSCFRPSPSAAADGLRPAGMFQVPSFKFQAYYSCMNKPQGIVILDFGGQYAHLIASRVRRLGVYSEIREAETPAEELKGVAGIILSGGPASVYEKGSPQGDKGIFKLGIPVLGICYGHQWIAHVLNGKVKPGTTKEYGHSEVENIIDYGILVDSSMPKYRVWMSHGDEVAELPAGFKHVLRSDACEIAGMADFERQIYGIQFHPEVAHTAHPGRMILENFVKQECKADPWSVKNYVETVSEEIKKQAGDRKVFMLVSGGVDSTVAFALLEKALGKGRVYGLLIDTGLMRKDEVSDTKSALKKLGFDNLHVEDASEKFFANLKEVYDPEEKRKIIGNTFIDVQREVAKKLRLDGNEWMLGQGTIYPDTIETGGTKHADKIKTHHNRVEEIQKMIKEGRVIEPLKDLYKDEVRDLGTILKLPSELVWRHPFPGPGLGVRILCSMQSNTVVKVVNGKWKMESGKLLPVKSVGVQGDSRTYRSALALFSGNPYEISEELWSKATKIPNNDQTINRVLKCISHREPVEFESSGFYITKKRADLLREADWIVNEEIYKAGLYEIIWQFPVVLLPFGASKGNESIVLRPVESTDAMTANAAHLPEKVIKKMTERILKLDGIDMVFYDLTSKPPATIEWE